MTIEIYFNTVNRKSVSLSLHSSFSSSFIDIDSLQKVSSMTLLCKKMGCTFLVIRNRLRFIATIESSLKQSELSKFVCWQHTTRRSYLSLHRFLTTPDQPAISLKTFRFLTSPIPSTDHRQLSGIFPSFSLRLLWRLQKYIFTFIILYAISVRENTQ